MNAENMHRTAADMFPSKQDWVDLQGGESRVYYDPKNPQGKAWRVVHVYEGADGTDFTNGSILPTMPPKGNRVGFADISLDNGKDDATRIIRFPRMMVYGLHGAPCEERSGNFANSAYDKIKNERDYTEYKLWLARAGMWELKYTLVGEKPMFIPHRIDIQLRSSESDR